MKTLSRGPVFEHILVLNGLVGKHCLMDKLTPSGQVSPRKVLVPLFGTWRGALSAIRSHVTTQSVSSVLPRGGRSGPADVPCPPYRRLIPTLTSINREKPRKGDSLGSRLHKSTEEKSAAEEEIHSLFTILSLYPQFPIQT